jgi:hypothetical protein
MKKIIYQIIGCLFIVIISACEKENLSEATTNEFISNSKANELPYTYNGPGVVVAHERYAPKDPNLNPDPNARRIYVSGPSICILPNGDLIASYDLGGPESGASTSGTTKMFKSTDGGTTWALLATLTDLMSANIFVHNDALYALGVSKSSGDVNGRAKMVIRKSLDNGTTWTTATSSTTGIIKYDINNPTANHTAPTPVVIHNGKIWRAMENVNGGGAWPGYFQSFMISAPVNSDLLNSNSWTKSSSIKAVDYNSTSIGSRFKGWLEGNAVLGPNNTMLNVLRVHQDETTTESKNTEYAALVDVSADGRTQSFDVNNLVQFPGGSKKFTIRYDSQTQKYWTLSNYVPNEYLNIKELNNVRNTIALCYSTNLKNWTVDSIILQSSEYSKIAFQYVDWQFDGEDIVAVSRTAYDDGGERNSNPHNANFLTFHRVSNFRDYQNQTLGIKKH